VIAEGIRIFGIEFSWPLIRFSYFYEISVAKEARGRLKTLRGKLLGCSVVTFKRDYSAD